MTVLMEFVELQITLTLLAVAVPHTLARRSTTYAVRAMYRASLGFPRAMAFAAASHADTESLPGNHDATKSVPSTQFPAASESSRVIDTSGMALIAGASGAGPGTHVQHASDWQTICFAQWPICPLTVLQGSSTLFPQQP